MHAIGFASDVRSLAERIVVSLSGTGSSVALAVLVFVVFAWFLWNLWNLY
jgi:hypothetical protein